MPITPSIGRAVYVDQCLRMAEVARLAQRQMESNGRISLPIIRHAEMTAQREVGPPSTPIRVRLNDAPTAVVHPEANWWILRRAIQEPAAESLQRSASPIDQGLDDLKKPTDLPSGPTDIVNHSLSPRS